MKRRNLLIAVAAILVMFAFAACSESVAPEDRLGTITFDNNTSRAVGTVVKYSDDVEDMYWYYSAKKLDDGFTTGNTGGKLVAVSSEKGLSGKTLASAGFSYGYWEIELKGFKSSGDTAAGVDTSGKPKYIAKLDNFLVSSTVNYATAKIEMGDGATTEIKFGDITFSADNILATSKFSLAVTDSNNTGTVNVPTGTGNVVAEEGKVTFKNLTYTPKEGADITGEHEMSFVLTQTLSSDDQTTSIDAALYTLKFKVQKGTTTTISGSLLKNDQTGTIQINSVQDVPELTLSRAIPVSDVSEAKDIATVSTDTTITYGNMVITLPEGTKIATTETGLSEDNSSADGTIAFKAKSSSSNQNDITVESGEGITPYELILPVSTVEEDGDKKNKQLVTVTNFIGKNRNITNICHNKTSITELTKAPGSEGFTEPTEESWYYDKADGNLTLYLFHASEINIIERKPVAVVNGAEKYYLSDAIGAISENGTLELLRDVTVDKKGEEAEAITVDKSFTLDLKNHSVTISSGSITLSADKVVTVKNSKPSQAAFINAVEVKDFTGVNRAYYPTLEAALEAVTEGGTVTLGAAVTLSSDVEISKNIIFDLNDKVLTPNGKSITVKSGTLTVKGSSNGQTAFVTGVASADTINGTYAPRVAKVGEVYYASLASAVAAVAKDGTVELLCDITLTDPITITESIKLDLNGHVITASGSNLIYVNAGTLKVTDKAEKQGDFVFGVEGVDDTYTASVAQIGNNDYYATLEDAAKEAEDGDTIVLLQDIDLTGTGGSEMVEFTANGTLDFNTSTICYGGVQMGSTSSSATNTNMTLRGSAPKGSYNVEAKYREGSGRELYQFAAVAVWTPTTIIESGRYYGTNALLVQYQGQADETSLIIKGGEFVSSEITLRQVIGKTVIYDGEFNANNWVLFSIEKGTSSVDTKIIVNGGNFDAGEKGCLILARDHNDWSIEINDGTFTYDWLWQSADDANITKENLVIKGGTFSTNPSSFIPYVADNGTYNGEPLNYVADGYEAVSNGNGTWTVKKSTAM